MKKPFFSSALSASVGSSILLKSKVRLVISGRPRHWVNSSTQCSAVFPPLQHAETERREIYVIDRNNQEQTRIFNKMLKIVLRTRRRFFEIFEISLYLSFFPYVNISPRLYRLSSAVLYQCAGSDFILLLCIWLMAMK